MATQTRVIMLEASTRQLECPRASLRTGTPPHASTHIRKPHTFPITHLQKISSPPPSSTSRQVEAHSKLGQKQYTETKKKMSTLVF